MIQGLKAAMRELTPPLLYRSVARVTNTVRRCLGSEKAWGPKPSSWYDGVYEVSEEYRAHYTECRYYPLWSVVADRVLRSGARRILDLGCGPGQFALLLADKGVTEYCGLDFSPPAIEQARAVCPAFQFHVADVCREGALESLDYDCCVALEFLEHVQKDVEILRRLRPGSRFYATVPNFPDTSHVRHFADARAVEARYRTCFSACRVDAHRADPRGTTFFLMEALIR